MNYIKEVNAFYNQIIFNPLSSSAVALWHTLMHVNNRSGWQMKFSVAASHLQLKAGLKATTFKRARQELQKKGYIKVTSPGGNRAASYEMISQQIIYGNNSFAAGEGVPLPTHKHDSHATKDEFLSKEQIQEQDSTDKSVLNSEKTNSSGYPNIMSAPTIQSHTSNHMSSTYNKPLQHDHSVSHHASYKPGYNLDHRIDYKMDHTTDPLIKQNNIRQYIYKSTATADHASTKTIAFYPDLSLSELAVKDALYFYQNNFGNPSPFIAEEILQWIRDTGETLVLHAMKLALEQGKPTWRYVKGILKAWKRKGITTVAKAVAEEISFRKKKPTSFCRTSHTEIIPDWFKEQKQRNNSKTKHPASFNKDPIMEAKELEEMIANYVNSQVVT